MQPTHNFAQTMLFNLILVILFLSLACMAKPEEFSTCDALSPELAQNGSIGPLLNSPSWTLSLVANQTTYRAGCPETYTLTLSPPGMAQSVDSCFQGLLLYASTQDKTHVGTFLNPDPNSFQCKTLTVNALRFLKQIQTSLYFYHFCFPI